MFMHLSFGVGFELNLQNLYILILIFRIFIFQKLIPNAQFRNGVAQVHVSVF